VAATQKVSKETVRMIQNKKVKAQVSPSSNCQAQISMVQVMEKSVLSHLVRTLRVKIVGRDGFEKLDVRIPEVEPRNRPTQIEVIENVHNGQKGKGEWRVL
nr:hypothetical protein [Tanacetum cinerariifolium]